MTIYLNVAVNFPKEKSILTYKSSDSTISFKNGEIVSIPLGKTRQALGCVVNEKVDESEITFSIDKIKNITQKVSDLYLPTNESLLYDWMSKYYHYSLGQLIFDTLPTFDPSKIPTKTKLKIIEAKKSEELLVLNSEQEKVFSSIKINPGKMLLHGITGSGKTLIYAHLMNQLFLQKKSVLYLIPEINLTVQFVDFFSKLFNVKIFLYNSEVNKNQKLAIYKYLLNSTEPMLIIGARSAVFLPFNNLGMIIVDEEHDNSFKQDDHCMYNARDVAIKKSSLYKVPILLGSATPALETYYNATEKKSYDYYVLDKRAQNSSLPNIEFVTLSKTDVWPISEKIYSAIHNALVKGEQVLILINRLGFADFIQCKSCKYVYKCKNCSVSLKYFKNKKILHCAFCDYSITYPEVCDQCGSMVLIQKGFGTEKILEVLSEKFPQKVVERFDRAEITTYKKLVTALDNFHSGKVDILVGTQMLSKGHNFKKVNLVVVLGVDSLLNFPDFRSEEKVYQLLVQISGRSGRFNSDSQVLIQTNNPENRTFKIIKEHKFNDFYSYELSERNLFRYPPFSKLIVLYFTAKNIDDLKFEVIEIKKVLDDLITKNYKEIEALGPTSANVEKKVNQYTWKILLKATSLNDLHNIVANFQRIYPIKHFISLKIDVDPMNIQ
ncbi:MAG: primosomal protein N' [Bacteriovoracaceae bacterium]